MDRYTMSYLGVDRAYAIDDEKTLFRIDVCVDDASTGKSKKLLVTLEGGTSLAILAGAFRDLADKIEQIGVSDG